MDRALAAEAARVGAQGFRHAQPIDRSCARLTCAHTELPELALFEGRSRQLKMALQVMNASLLIHAIVRQTTVLIATLATSSGQRAQLAAVANAVWADLVRELREQGLGNKVIADMFGMALRTYHRKVARMSGSRTLQGRSLWEAVLGHIQQYGPLSRAEVLQRFVRDDTATLHSVIADLVSSGLVESQGDSDSEQLSAAKVEEKDGSTSIDSLVLVTLHRHGPLDAAGVAAQVPAPPDMLDAALRRLVAERLIAQVGDTYSCENCVIPFGEAVGWEAAVLDHYQALVAAIVTKLRSGNRRSDLSDSIGGSTFVFEVWQGHPMEAEILGYLRSMRERGVALRRELEEHPIGAEPPAGARLRRVTAYVGQSVTDEGDDDA